MLKKDKTKAAVSRQNVQKFDEGVKSSRRSAHADNAR
jgi:hypothetical protein